MIGVLLLLVGKLIATGVFFSACAGVLDVVVVGEIDGGRLLEVWLDGVKLMTLGGDPLRR